MDLEEVFKQLFFGELSQTTIGASGGSSAITEANYPRVINYINLAVLALHERFSLIEKEVFVQLYDEITDYHIDWDFAATNPADPGEEYRYIVDTAIAPFNSNRVLQILSVWNEEGKEYDLDPVFVESAIETYDAEQKQLIAYRPSQLLLQIPYPDDANAIAVICRATPNNIDTDETTLTTKIELPEVLLPPLLAHIGDRYFSTIPRNNDEAVIYPNKFETACKQIESKGLIAVAQARGYNRFHRDGWR